MFQFQYINMKHTVHSLICFGYMRIHYNDKPLLGFITAANKPNHTCR